MRVQIHKIDAEFIATDNDELNFYYIDLSNTPITAEGKLPNTDKLINDKC